MNEQHFVTEVRGFLFYSKYFWPLHRKFLKKIITPRCQKCIISANYTPLNKDGFCQSCVTQISDKKEAIPAEQQRMGSDLDNALIKLQGSGTASYDALVLFSGGKDSCYLVHKLKETYPKLRMLLISIDNTIMSPIALKNIARTVQLFNLDYFSYRPSAALYNKMFRYSFLHLNKKGCSGTVDQFDGDFLHDIGRNWAAKLKIPVLISGCSRTQVERILGLSHFESPRDFETQARTSVAGIELNKIFSPEEMHYWKKGSSDSEQYVPRVIYPFYAWNLDENFIKNTVVELGFITQGSDNPLLTNNQLIPLMAIVDMIQLGYSSFEPEFSQMVREGKADPVFWKNIFELSEYASKTGHFISKSVDQMLTRLELTRKDMRIPE